MPRDLLITGFTAFGPFAANPAETVARRLAVSVGARFEPLEVSYAAAEALVDRLRVEAPDEWLMLGVAGGSDHVRIERVARNHVGPTPDVRGVVRGPGPIDADHPDVVPGTLSLGTAAGGLPACCRHSDDAGDYLCNFVYRLAVTRLPRVRSAFVHVAPFDRVPEDEQVRAVLTLLAGRLP